MPSMHSRWIRDHAGMAAGGMAQDRPSVARGKRGVRRVERRDAEVPDRRPPAARLRAGRVEEALSDEAIRAIEEGRADHDAGRTFTMAEIKRELGIDS